MFNLKTLTATAVGLTMIASAAVAQTNIRIQSVISAKADEVVMLKNFAQDVSDLTNGSVTFEVLPAGAVVGVKETLDAVEEPIESMADFRKYRFRTPPGIPGQTYKDIGVASVAMGGGDILPALEKGTIDAAEWCCPKPDSVFGFQKVLKHYYLQGLHQVVVNADLYLNKDVYNSLTPLEQKAIEVAANASLSKSMSYRIYENGKALKDLTENHGVILHDTPADYFPAYMNAHKRLTQHSAKPLLIA